MSQYLELLDNAKIKIQAYKSTKSCNKCLVQHVEHAYDLYSTSGKECIRLTNIIKSLNTRENLLKAGTIQRIHSALDACNDEAMKLNSALAAMVKARECLKTKQPSEAVQFEKAGSNKRKHQTSATNDGVGDQKGFQIPAATLRNGSAVSNGRKSSEPDGFRGIKWGTGLAEVIKILPDTLRLLPTEPDERDHKAFEENPVNDFNLFGIVPHMISYSFKNDRFYKAIAHFTSLPEADFLNIEQSMIDAYGKYGYEDSKRVSNGIIDVWKGNSLDICLVYRRHDGMTILMYDSTKTNPPNERAHCQKSIQSSESDKWFERGMSLEDAQRYEEAIDAFTKVIEINPHSVRAFLSRGRNYQTLGHFQRAIEDYDEAIRLHPSIFFLDLLYADRGIAYDKLGQHKRAIQDYN